MATVLNQAEATLEHAEDVGAALGKTLGLVLDVVDPEVIVELRKHSAGDERNQFALTALRVGVLSLREASGQLDAATIKEAGARLVADMHSLLSERAKDLTHSIATSLTRYFDPSTGVMQQRLDALLKTDGELEHVLARHLGSDDSVLARTLSGYLGEQSPVFKLLSPSEAQGIKCQVEATLDAALKEQRERVLEQFSLDNKDSALTRLVQEMQVIQGNLTSEFSSEAEKIREEFSLDAPDSALSRLVGKVEAAQAAIAEQFSGDNEQSVMNRFSRLLENTSATIDRNLTLDDEQSALYRLKREMEATIDSLVQKNNAFHSDVKETLARIESRREESAKSTLHGAAFEDELCRLLATESQSLGDVCDAIGVSRS